MLNAKWKSENEERERDKQRRKKKKSVELILWHVAVKYIKPKGYREYMCAHFVNMLTNDYEWFMSWWNRIRRSQCNAKFVVENPNVSANCGSISTGIWVHINSFRINIYTNKLKLKIVGAQDRKCNLFVQFIIFFVFLPPLHSVFVVFVVVISHE